MDDQSKEYRQGYEQGVKDLAERLKTYYGRLSGTTYAVLAAYHIEESMKQMLEKEEKGSKNEKEK